jgi:hypothetical protein
LNKKVEYFLTKSVMKHVVTCNTKQKADINTDIMLMDISHLSRIDKKELQKLGLWLRLKLHSSLESKATILDNNKVNNSTLLQQKFKLWDLGFTWKYENENGSGNQNMDWGQMLHIDGFTYVQKYFKHMGWGTKQDIDVQEKIIKYLKKTNNRVVKLKTITDPKISSLESVLDSFEYNGTNTKDLEKVDVDVDADAVNKMQNIKMYIDRLGLKSVTIVDIEDQIDYDAIIKDTKTSEIYQCGILVQFVLFKLTENNVSFMFHVYISLIVIKFYRVTL